MKFEQVYANRLHSDVAVVQMNFTRAEKQSNGIISAYSNVSLQITTKPKRNADFRAKRNGLYIFMKSLNLMALTLDKKK
ncbi:hypothetical protein CJ263_09555 [Maribacter cobaltidurans]|uniref:Uncharacterized protein n=1 Tax=Maribacter cobaltidurans TaxID=1178778 RepID=A0A223V614_9FLAO|nr:hypothetical protein CJ263_09555 [Maribacter cobaltidurans]GGD78669.1 hypothetical protein GCM10011412_15590 [Maribacter cobaltidurans]